ncbi:unnamed protein product [Rotaria sp. Silwood2]|nr:unnamed protein product [Rotaria sp. Silwood2]CAF4226367.1 unnamed protein product [Rotaria sp. Silwood2]
MLLIANSCLAEVMFALNILGVAVFTLQNDLKQIQYQDSLCSLRGYFTYSLCTLQNYSYLLQAINRYVTVVYPTRLFWQSTRTQMLLIGVTWIFSFVYSVPFLFTGKIIYDADNQVCLLSLRLSFSICFVSFCNYMLPAWMIRLTYFNLVRYVKKMNNCVTSANNLYRAQRELKMVHRIVILIMILMTINFPYGVFIMISFFTTPPKYYFRFSIIFMYLSVICVMITLFQFTDSLKKSIKKLINVRPNIVVPTVAAMVKINRNI